MGCGASTQASPPRQLVLLGGGECGKTTIFKQIQILHGTGFGDNASDWLNAIHQSPLRSLRVLLQAIEAAVAAGGADLDPAVKVRCHQHGRGAGLLAAHLSVDPAPLCAALLGPARRRANRPCRQPPPPSPLAGGSCGGERGVRAGW